MIKGERLRQLRESRNISQERFALGIKIGVAQVGRYEREENDPTSDVLARMAVFFGVSSDYLIGLTDNPTPKVSELNQLEAAAVSAWRHGDKLGAIRVIAGEE